MDIDQEIIEVIKSADDENIKCYKCLFCGTIFTVRNGVEFEHCPACDHIFGGHLISKQRYNLIKFWRKTWSGI